MNNDGALITTAITVVISVLVACVVFGGVAALGNLIL